MKRMLPLVATLVMGVMSRQTAPGGGSSLTSGAGAGGLLEMLGGAFGYAATARHLRTGSRAKDGSPHWTISATG
jgi:hypothetical protein